ncbi:3-hydroxyacyl-[acyl-carrier-protein] dehydratase FabZ [Maioricimonas rarisocia]|uniref:3-hydroxyacyl-[acyl-carrier-protein] dehydratase FabZ n=1 Tax=Maioricimonas rarisocia TaxID=2528026 RepID=A0A517Z8J0_9PLAN|nr:beta-hydroxyacyl-ACP dehydratase [Maioricimonas rarisocia]QDU38810.1 3-hydroxyacyl-[acyl-carrier-protein] dehydratase FabZ [Maioricimonas rarisocia]
MSRRAFFDYRRFDCTRPRFGPDEIRRVNPQRHEMEQLSGVVWADEQAHEVAGFKDVREDEFWVRGHMPDYALMPGVIMCEAAGQLVSFYVRHFDVLSAGDFIGFGGMDRIRFRHPVFPGTRLMLGARATRIDPRFGATFQLQGYADGRVVFGGEMVAVTLSSDEAPRQPVVPGPHRRVARRLAGV